MILPLGKKGRDKGKSKVDVTTSADSSIVDLGEVKQDMEKALEILRHDFIKTLSIRTSQGKPFSFCYNVTRLKDILITLGKGISVISYRFYTSLPL